MGRVTAWPAFCAVTALVVWTSAGCSVEAQHSTPTLGGDTSTSRPLLDLIDEDADGDPLVDRMRMETVTRCMREAGFPNYAAPAPITARTKEDRQTLSGLGRTTVSDGNVPPATPDQPLPTAQAKALEGSGKMEQVTGPNGEMAGFPVDGCAAKGDLAVFGGIEERRARTLELMSIRQAQTEANQAMLADSRVTDKIGQWSTCMKGKGHAYASPEDISADQPADTEWSQWSVAQDDVACKKETGLMETGFAVMSEKEEAAVNANPGIVTSWRQRQQQILQRAQAALSSTGAPTG